ncbi:hypothetical protein OIU79_026839 [Salix purpurea]|uniref:Uncharacterized protein n=1 Tax=Salix purpurea TaxID=77065 RepID=A0A9Q0VT36_SALPP|nr:hypothetical protein OIU79_026839 [Salix purpurea]
MFYRDISRNMQWMDAVKIFQKQKVARNILIIFIIQAHVMPVHETHVQW